MWIFSKSGFLSIVENDASDDPSVALLVRARAKKDLSPLAYFARVRIFETPEADYRFRLFASRRAVASYVAREALLLDYPNFKAEIERLDPKRASLLNRVWVVMREIGGPR